VVNVQVRSAQGAQLYRRLLRVSTYLQPVKITPCYCARRLVNFVHETPSKTAKIRYKEPKTKGQNSVGTTSNKGNKVDQR